MCAVACVPCLAVLCLAAGRLDYCTDSWALGMLVLCLRKGKQPFWWLKDEATLPSGGEQAFFAFLQQASLVVYAVLYIKPL
jgi:hypothetical protein